MSKERTLQDSGGKRIAPWPQINIQKWRGSDGDHAPKTTFLSVAYGGTGTRSLKGKEARENIERKEQGKGKAIEENGLA